jgi:hypothetical protein
LSVFRSGILVSSFMKRIESATRESFEAMNQALKKRAEMEPEG